jgi:hypothetical protein
MRILAILVELLPQLFEGHVLHFAAGSAFFLGTVLDHVPEAQALKEFNIQAIKLLLGLLLRGFWSLLNPRTTLLTNLKLYFWSC